MPYVSDLATSSTWTSSATPVCGLAVDPLGGAGQPYWEPINSVYGLDIAVVNPTIDPHVLVHDGRS